MFRPIFKTCLPLLPRHAYAACHTTSNDSVDLWSAAAGLLNKIGANITLSEATTQPHRQSPTPSAPPLTPATLPKTLQTEFDSIESSFHSCFRNIDRIVQAEWTAIAKERAALKDERIALYIAKAQWEAHDGVVRARNTKLEDIIHLNVGGEKITTTRSTLTKFPNTVMWAMFSGRHVVSTDSRGRIFIDRNPIYFKMILEWLRAGLAPKLAPAQRKALWVELEFFGLVDEFLNTSMETFTDGVDLEKFTLSVTPACQEGGPGNTADDVKSELLTYGACAKGTPAIIEVRFEDPVLISGISLAAFFCGPWMPTHGAGAWVEYYDGREWQKVETVPENFGTMKELVNLKWSPKLASKWRLIHPTTVGISRLIFH